MKDLVVDPIWVMGALFTVLGIIGGWYIVRLDTMVEMLRSEVIKMEKDIGGLKNADVSCTRDQDILKKDMSHIRQTLLRLVGKAGLHKALRNRKKY